MSSFKSEAKKILLFKSSLREVRLIHQNDRPLFDFIFSENSFDMCELTVVGQAFLWHQIRCIVAVLFLVGQGKETPQVNTVEASLCGHSHWAST